MAILKCKICNNDFEVKTSLFNKYKKRGWGFRCLDCRQKLGEKLTLECPVCGKTFVRKHWQIKTKSGLSFCSRSCAATYNNTHCRTGENNPNCIDGRYMKSSYAKKAFRAYVPKCAACGLKEECCLQVHHIDKDRQNDDINNLIILCANCHCRVHRGKLELTKELLDNREMV